MTALSHTDWSAQIELAYNCMCSADPIVQLYNLQFYKSYNFSPCSSKFLTKIFLTKFVKKTEGAQILSEGAMPPFAPSSAGLL